MNFEFSKPVRTSLGLVVTVLLSACGPVYSATARLQNPARSQGPLIGATVTQRNYPPDEATLSVFSPGEVCFDVTLRGGPQYAQLQSWNVYLVVDGRNDLPIRGPRFVAASTHNETWEGRQAYYVQNGNSTECTIRNRYGQCERVEQRPMYDTRYERVDRNFAAGNSRICFDNSGFASPATRTLELQLENDDPNTHNMEFRWEFY